MPMYEQKIYGEGKKKVHLACFDNAVQITAFTNDKDAAKKLYDMLASGQIGLYIKPADLSKTEQ
jgi:hypothetical protein